MTAAVTPLLALPCSWASSTSRAAGAGGLLAAAPGLRVYDVFGQPRARLEFGRAVRMAVGRRYAYVSVERPRHRTYVIDLRSSAIVERLPTAQPPILLGS
jgi:hypothetical protein